MGRDVYKRQDVDTVDVVSRHAVAADFEAFERRNLIFVVVAEVTHFGLEHQHEIRVLGQRLEPLRLELPLVEFDPAVTLLICFVRHLAVRAVGKLRQLLVVFAVPERVGGRELHRCAELRTAARIDRLVHRVACEDEFEREQVGGAVGHAERIPVFEREAFVARLAVKREVGVGPVETLAQTCRQTVRCLLYTSRCV